MKSLKPYHIKSSLSHLNKSCYKIIRNFSNLRSVFSELIFHKKQTGLSAVFISLLIINGCITYQSFELAKIKEKNCHLTEKERNEILRIAEYQMEFYKQVFHYPKNFYIRIEIFGDSLQYKKNQNKISKNARSNNGFYSSSYKKAIIYKNKRYLKTISHEMNHFILRSKLNTVPKWINEGLSEYYEMAHLEDNIVVVDPQVKKVKRIFEFITRPNKLDIADFLNWENKKWSEVNKAGEHYSSTLSWAMIYYLKAQSNGDDILKSFLLDLKNGKNSREVVQNNYPEGISKLEEDIIDFFQSEFIK